MYNYIYIYIYLFLRQKFKTKIKKNNFWINRHTAEEVMPIQLIPKPYRSYDMNYIVYLFICSKTMLYNQWWEVIHYTSYEYLSLCPYAWNKISLQYIMHAFKNLYIYINSSMYHTRIHTYICTHMYIHII